MICFGFIKRSIFLTFCWQTDNKQDEISIHQAGRRPIIIQERGMESQNRFRETDRALEIAETASQMIDKYNFIFYNNKRYVTYVIRKEKRICHPNQK